MSLRRIFLFGLLSLLTFKLGLLLTVLFSPGLSFRDLVPRAPRVSYQVERGARWQFRVPGRSADVDEELAAAVAALGDAADDYTLNRIQQRVAQLEGNGQAFLGIYPAKAHGGVLISDVIPNDPAARAGLRAGDVITSINGRQVSSLGNLRQVLLGLEPHVPAVVTCERNGFTQEVSLSPAARPVKRMPLTHRALGLAYAAIGRRAEAAAQFESYLNEAGQSPDAQSIRSQIDQLRR